MQKLTKEQRDYILNLMENKSIGLTLSAERGREGAYIRYDDIELLLDKCTEKEFPEIFMRPKHVDDEEELKVYETDCDNADQKCIVIFSYEEYTHMDREQFKQFAQKINKIVEWLKEQE